VSLAPPPAELSPPEREVFAALAAYRMAGSAAYNTMLTARPQALGYGMADSPAGLAAFQLVHPGYAQWLDGRDRRQVPARDEVLDNLSLYWLTNSVASSARIYWENGGRAVPGILSALDVRGIAVAAVTVSRPSLDDVYLHYTGRDFAADDVLATEEEAV